MATQLEIILRGYQRPIITDIEIKALLATSDNSRYAIIKRALAKGDLIRLRRGLYLLGPHLTNLTIHPYEVAQLIYGPSYISLESALSYHQLIPEAVYGITSVSIKRNKTFATAIGVFSYASLPQKDFFIDVCRVKELSSFFIANPFKALCDYVYCHKKDWVGSKPLIENLRIEIEDLPKLDIHLADALSQYYKTKRIDKFMYSLTQEGF